MDRSDQSAGEVLHGHFYDIFKHMGIAATPEQHEAMREACELLADKFIKVFEKEAALPNSRKLAKAVDEAFKSYEKVLDRHEERLNALEAMRTADVEAASENLENPEDHYIS